MKVTELPILTRMAGGDEPLDVFIQHGPPELLPQVGKGRKNNLVPNCLMHLRDDVETILQLNDELLAPHTKVGMDA